MITEKEMMKIKRGDKVLVECTVEAVFVKSGMVMVTTRDCDKGFDAYEDEVIAVMPDKVTNGNMIKAMFPNGAVAVMSYPSNKVGFITKDGNPDDNYVWYPTSWWNAPYNGEGEE